MYVAVIRQWRASLRNVTVAAVLLAAGAAASAEPTPAFDVHGDLLRIQAGNRTLHVSLAAPEFTIDGRKVEGGRLPANVRGTVGAGQAVAGRKRDRFAYVSAVSDCRTVRGRWGARRVDSSPN
jgi:hypothetical protein